jgi:exonuclease III
MLNILIDDYNLVDIWRHYHPNLRQYTRHQYNPKAMSRLDYILISEKSIGSCHKSKILPGVASDHSIVTLSLLILTQILVVEVLEIEL